MEENTKKKTYNGLKWKLLIPQPFVLLVICCGLPPLTIILGWFLCFPGWECWLGFCGVSALPQIKGIVIMFSRCLKQIQDKKKELVNIIYIYNLNLQKSSLTSPHITLFFWEQKPTFAGLMAATRLLAVLHGSSNGNQRVFCGWWYRPQVTPGFVFQICWLLFSFFSIYTIMNWQWNLAVLLVSEKQIQVYQTSIGWNHQPQDGFSPVFCRCFFFFFFSETLMKLHGTWWYFWIQFYGCNHLQNGQEKQLLYCDIRCFSMAKM